MSGTADTVRADGAGVAGALYTGLVAALLPVVALYLLWRSLRQPAYRRHWAERFLGRAAAPRPPGTVVWVHAVSVGETRAAQPLIEALAAARPGLGFVLTHTTPTGRDTGAAIAAAWPGRVVQRYLPYDAPFAVRRFFAETRPQLGVLMETEAWPNLLAAARAAGCPTVLANARLSERSLARGLRWRGLLRAAAARLAAVFAQTPADGERIARLYDGPIEVLGNLKFDLDPAPALLERGQAWRATVGARPLWLFASTREGEEALLLAALERRAAALARHDPVLLFVPRHPQRFDEVARRLAATGTPPTRRSEPGAWPRPPAGRPAALLGDSMGEMPAYYAMADVAVIGGSLLPLGGQNLIEACACGCPVVVGPHTFNFAQASADAVAAGAALRVADADAAIEALLALADDPVRCATMRGAALGFAAAHRGATARTAARLLQRLAPPPEAAPAGLSAPAAR